MMSREVAEKLQVRNAILAEENEKLRSALDKIAVWPDHDEREPANSMARIARAVLKADQALHKPAPEENS